MHAVTLDKIPSKIFFITTRLPLLLVIPFINSAIPGVRQSSTDLAHHEDQIRTPFESLAFKALYARC